MIGPRLKNAIYLAIKRIRPVTKPSPTGKGC